MTFQLVSTFFTSLAILTSAILAFQALTGVIVNELSNAFRYAYFAITTALIMFSMFVRKAKGTTLLGTYSFMLSPSRIVPFVKSELSISGSLQKPSATTIAYIIVLNIIAIFYFVSK